MKKNEASEFLAMGRKEHGGNRPCSLERCDLETSDAIDVRNLRLGKRGDSSSSESAMVPQDILLPPTPPAEVTI
ncbi:hypothetical protein GDO78_018466 [Eleutherodactylus coqui]|uniref:Uncharacterized protein n=1 Tax=Eleutherodactylus coqui TaxID=57060 RepID=A0A8J6BKJ7_ELECQ|nr:hypothetical protein GDO78_018466 [Eleutherodactylus coqui]